MPTFLKWRTSEIGSKDRITADLFSYLSSRWYPVNVIRSTIYNIFGTYAVELSSASVEVSQVYNDLAINSVRTSPVGTNSTSKIYDNFGALLGVDKLYNQDYEKYSNFYSLQSYRQQLRLLGDAFFSGMSVEGLSRVGQAYTGVSPIVIQPLKYYDGWVLNTYTGSVVAVGNGLIGIDQDIPRIGHYIPVSSGSSPFVIDDRYGVSNSVIGFNTIVRDIQHYYAGVVVNIYAASASISNSSFRDSIEYSMGRVLKADQKPFYYYSDQFASYRPSTGSVTGSVVDGIFSLSSKGYLYNSAPTNLSGSVFVGTPITMGDLGTFWDVSLWDGFSFWDDDCYDLYYDWLTLVKNDAYYVMSVRTYPSYTIPSTVYYQDFNSNPISRLPHSSNSSTVAHWVFDDNDEKIYSIGSSTITLSLPENPELIPNGGFEFHNGIQDDGITDTFSGWMATASIGGGVDSSAIRRSGTGSMKLISNAGATGSIASASASVVLDPYSSYTYKHWTKCNAGGLDTGCLQIRGSGSQTGPKYLQADSTWSAINTWILTGNSGSWSKYSIDFRTPLDATTLVVTIGSTGSVASGSVYFDDVSLKKTIPSLPAFGRSEDWTGREITKTPFIASLVNTTALNFSGSFYFEMWLRGVDSNNKASSMEWPLKGFFLKRQENVEVILSATSSVPFSLNGKGYAFGLDFKTQQLKMLYTSGGVSVDLSKSISEYMLETPSRYHYFAGTYLSGSVYLYVDGQVAYHNPSAGTMDALSAVGNIYMSASGALISGPLTLPTGSIIIDEFVASNGFLDPYTAKSHFEITKPRFLRLGVRREDAYAYHQPKVTVYASGSNEFEFHQFNVRALQGDQTAFFDKKLVDIYRLPLFKV